MQYTKLGTSDLTVSHICMGFVCAKNGQHFQTILGTAKLHHTDAVKAVNLTLTAEECAYLDHILWLALWLRIQQRQPKRITFGLPEIRLFER